MDREELSTTSKMAGNARNETVKDNHIANTISQKPCEGPFQRTGAKKSQKMTLDTLNPKVTAKMAIIPVKYRSTYRKAMTGKSLRAAVNSFCLECTGWQREEIRLCTSPACPLFCFRPYQEKRNG